MNLMFMLLYIILYDFYSWHTLRESRHPSILPNSDFYNNQVEILICKVTKNKRVVTFVVFENSQINETTTSRLIRDFKGIFEYRVIGLTLETRVDFKT